MSDWTHYLGPVGAAYDYLTKGSIDSPSSYLDPGDFFNNQKAKDVQDAANKAHDDLMHLSDTAWLRQMQGLQMALGSMNNYNGVLSNLYGVPTNYYDPSQMGGVLGVDPSRPAPPPNAPLPIPPSTGPAVETRKGAGHF